MLCKLGISFYHFHRKDFGRLSVNFWKGFSHLHANSSCIWFWCICFNLDCEPNYSFVKDWDRDHPLLKGESLCLFNVGEERIALIFIAQVKSINCLPAHYRNLSKESAILLLSLENISLEQLINNKDRNPRHSFKCVFNCFEHSQQAVERWFRSNDCLHLSIYFLYFTHIKTLTLAWRPMRMRLMITRSIIPFFISISIVLLFFLNLILLLSHFLDQSNWVRHFLVLIC